MAGRRRKKQRLEKTAGAGEGDAPSGEIVLRDAEPEDTPSPSVHVVVSHGYVGPPSYSVFQVDPYADGADPVRLPRRLARLTCDFNKSFVLVRRPGGGVWIVGVGGTSSKTDYGPETIVFDAETRAVFPGPDPGRTKRHPVLLAVGERVYALSRKPSINGRVNDDGIDSRIDFLPWFEVLDLSESRVDGGRLAGCEWRTLPRPPFFPWQLTPYQYIRSAGWFEFCSVASYAAVGSHILVSVFGKEARPGTHAFNTETERWTTVDAENSLPFRNGAVPHGRRDLFLGVSRATGFITTYKINLVVAGPSPSLSIVKVPVELPDEWMEHTQTAFLSLGIDRGFCTFDSWSVEDRPLGYADLSPCRRAHIRVRSYGTDDFDGEWIVMSKQWTQVYKIRDLIRRLDDPCVQHAFAI